LNTDGSDSVLKGEAKREDDVSSLDSVEEMTSMADAVTPPIDIEPFSLDIDTQCKVELLSFDQHSREAEIMSVEDGVAEVLQSLLQVCRESPGLEENPPTVGQLVAVLGTSGAYIRAKILSIKLSSKQVMCTPLDMGGGLLTRHLKFVYKLPDTEVVPQLVQKVQISYASLSVLHGQNCIGQRFLVRLSDITHPAILPLVDLAPLPAVPLSDLAPVSVEPKCRGDEAWPEEAGSLCSSYSLASCLSLQVGKIQEVTVTHVEGPREVYLCPDQKELERIQTHIFSTGQSLNFDPNFRPTIHSMVLACSPDDHYWYRALVEKVYDSSAIVFCPDFGFRTSVSFQEIRDINKKLAFARQKFLSARCVLADWEFEQDQGLSEREVRNLKKLLPVSAVKVKASIIRKKEEGFIVMVNGVDKKSLSGKTSRQALDLEERMELERLRLEVAKWAIRVDPS